MAKRSFVCGHQGKGQYCHRCKQADALATVHQHETAAQLLQRQHAREAWEASFADDPIDLSALQTRERVLKARDLLCRLAAGTPYTSVGGKRWESDRNIISVPVGRSHRLVLRDQGTHLRPLACMTHEAYNGLKRGNFS